MNFGYEVIRLWQRPAEELFAGDVGVTPLAMLARLPTGTHKNDALASIAQLAGRSPFDFSLTIPETADDTPLVQLGLRHRLDRSRSVGRTCAV